MTNLTTSFAFVNNTGSSTAYAYVTGQDINKDNAYAFLQSDGKTVYYPASPSSVGQPLAVDCAISLGAPGATTTITVPQLAGGRVWFVIDSKLTFLLNPGPGIVEPAVTNQADANYNLNWGFCEFTWYVSVLLYYNQQQLFVNISYVDFVSIPIALQLENTAGAVQAVQGLPADGLDQICSQLTSQGASENAGWGNLVIKAKDGSNLRAVSPNSGIVMDNSLFSDYYSSYVSQVWSKYTSEDLTINTQAQWGSVTGKISNDVLAFSDGTFAQPSAADIFSCSTGPFGNYPTDTSAEMGAIGARLAAAFNRSTLLANADQPNGESTANFYTTSPTNHYARIVHSVNLDHRGYAFPYDDVASDGETAPDQAGTVFDGSPRLLTITIGGPTSAGSNDGKKETEGEDGKKDGGKTDGGEADNGKEDGGKKKTTTGGVKGVLAKMKGLITGCFGSRK
ncbi:glucanase B [Xylariaceae sp. FL1019]|nr:glucanase B [Xylariaceae sp. FL1019]